VDGILPSRLPASDCDDALQDLFVAAFGGIATLQKSANIGTRLAGIARHHAANYCRRRSAALVTLESQRELEVPKASFDGALTLREIKGYPPRSGRNPVRSTKTGALPVTREVETASAANADPKWEAHSFARQKRARFIVCQRNHLREPSGYGLQGADLRLDAVENRNEAGPQSLPIPCSTIE
jgi:hypothetical protein